MEIYIDIVHFIVITVKISNLLLSYQNKTKREKEKKIETFVLFL